MTISKDVQRAAVWMTLLFGVGVVSAHADTYRYTFTPNSGGSDGFSFETSSNPFILSESSTSFLALVSGSADGQELTHSLATFRTRAAGGGLDFSGECSLSHPGNCDYDFKKFAMVEPALFTGSTSSPTLLQGSFVEGFDVIKTMDGPPQPSFVEEGYLTVRDVTPEPSSLMLLGTGLLGLVGVGRRRVFWR